MLENADLTLDDITILDFADDAKAAAAFLRGEGDFYYGSLPQGSNCSRNQTMSRLRATRQSGQPGCGLAIPLSWRTTWTRTKTPS
jgi:hypothetical protein